MKIPTICRYCGGKIIKSTTRALYPKGSEPIYLCVNCNAYGKGEEKETDFFDVVAWRSTAEFICKYFTKGRMISVDGRLQTRGWKDREGNNRVSIEILVDNAYFADSKKDDAAGDFPADDQFAGYGAYQGSVPGGGDDFAPDF